MQSASHPWLLVAPWYRWSRWPTPPTPTLGRASAPVIEKYASATFIEEFLAEPQRTLKNRNEDFVQQVVTGTPSRYALSALTLQKTSLRKLFLPTHSRFYVVVAELRCDVAGFPSVAREQVCQAGFVVRRRAVTIAPQASSAVTKAATDIAKAQVRGGGLVRRAAVGIDTGVFAKVRTRQKERQLARIAEVVKTRYDELRKLAAQGLVGEQLQGWVAGDAPGIGSWQPVEETPGVIGEAIYPLYPLVPDPTFVSHTARGRSIWFGVVPAGSEDLDASGNPRYDDRTTYEIRCFVRRHKAGCPRTSAVPDCHGEVVWSLPSEPYRLAAHFDAIGTSNRPVTIQLPDLKQLEAQTNTRPFGEAIGVRMVAPANSALEFTVAEDGTPTRIGIGGPSVCGFAIPLITIVATFVLNLFLPVVVFVFQLWFLLLLKFCIPPQFSLNATISNTLKAAMDADVDVSLDANAEANVIAAIGAHDPRLREALQNARCGGLSLNTLGALASILSTDFRDGAPPDIADDLPPRAPDVRRAGLPSLTTGLEYRTDFHPVPG